jgi:hypothetical protein
VNEPVIVPNLMALTDPRTKNLSDIRFCSFIVLSLEMVRAEDTVFVREEVCAIRAALDNSAVACTN